MNTATRLLHVHITNTEHLLEECCELARPNLSKLDLAEYYKDENADLIRQDKELAPKLETMFKEQLLGHDNLLLEEFVKLSLSQIDWKKIAEYVNEYLLQSMLEDEGLL